MLPNIRRLRRRCPKIKQQQVKKPIKELSGTSFLCLCNFMSVHVFPLILKRRFLLCKTTRENCLFFYLLACVLFICFYLIYWFTAKASPPTALPLWLRSAITILNVLWCVATMGAGKLCVCVGKHVWKFCLHYWAYSQHLVGRLWKYPPAFQSKNMELGEILPEKCCVIVFHCSAWIDSKLHWFHNDIYRIGRGAEGVCVSD